MQFSTIITSFALAIMATAAPAPAPAPNGGAWPVPGQTAQNDCGAHQVAACCNGGLNLLGSECSPLNLVQIIDQQCTQQQTVACCAQSGNQVGLINLALPCIVLPIEL